MIEVNAILNLHKKTVQDWHMKSVFSQREPLWNFIEENHQWNFSLWHEEDIARVKNIEDSKIVIAKRNIDSYNQSRNNAIEKIDEWILTYLQSKNILASDKLHSETPGMIIDRLSIMSLKRFHMFEEAIRVDATEEHKIKCTNKVTILDEQINDLANCLQLLLEELQSGKLRFKVYRQFKMYNDPNLNPKLYGKTQNRR